MTIAFSWIWDSHIGANWDNHSRVLNTLHTYELGIVSMGKFIDLLSLSHSLLAVGTVNCLSTCSTPFTSLIACSRNWLIMQNLPFFEEWKFVEYFEELFQLVLGGVFWKPADGRIYFLFGECWIRVEPCRMSVMSWKVLKIHGCVLHEWMNEWIEGFL